MIYRSQELDKLWASPFMCPDGVRSVQDTSIVLKEVGCHKLNGMTCMPGSSDGVFEFYLATTVRSGRAFTARSPLTKSIPTSIGQASNPLLGAGNNQALKNLEDWYVVLLARRGEEL